MSGLDLIVIGAGELGCRVAHRWKKLNQDAKVFLKTNSEKTERDAIWQAAGFETFSNEKERSVKAPYVVFCAPPTGKMRPLTLTMLTQYFMKALGFLRQRQLRFGRGRSPEIPLGGCRRAPVFCFHIFRRRLC